MQLCILWRTRDLLAGSSAAGGTAVLCTYPLDLARTKLANQQNGTMIAQPKAVFLCWETIVWICYMKLSKQGILRTPLPNLVVAISILIINLNLFIGLDMYFVTIQM